MQASTREGPFTPAEGAALASAHRPRRGALADHAGDLEASSKGEGRVALRYCDGARRGERRRGKPQRLGRQRRRRLRRTAKERFRADASSRSDAARKPSAAWTGACSSTWSSPRDVSRRPRRERAADAPVDLLYFILLVSTLIFVHESGHFAFAKIFGVKVLTFSLGFGPKLLQIRGRETTYCVSLFPFGGFVKMLEEGTEGAGAGPAGGSRAHLRVARPVEAHRHRPGRPGDECTFSHRALHLGLPRGPHLSPARSVGAVQPGKPADGQAPAGRRDPRAPAAST